MLAWLSVTQVDYCKYHVGAAQGEIDSQGKRDKAAKVEPVTAEDTNVVIADRRCGVWSRLLPRKASNRSEPPGSVPANSNNGPTYTEEQQKAIDESRANDAARAAINERRVKFGLHEMSYSTYTFRDSYFRERYCQQMKELELLENPPAPKPVIAPEPAPEPDPYEEAWNTVSDLPEAELW